MAAERVQRSLARAGFGSRRASEELVRDGRVRINGRVAQLGDRVDPATDVVEVDGARIVVNPDARTFALHKPRGIVSSLRDPQGRPDLSGFLPEGVRVVPVGRLDLETEGLLLLTSDGDLANRLTHPRYGVEKEYLAEVDGAPSGKQIAALRSGVQLDDGPARPRSLRLVDAAGERSALRGGSGRCAACSPPSASRSGASFASALGPSGSDRSRRGRYASSPERSSARCTTRQDGSLSAPAPAGAVERGADRRSTPTPGKRRPVRREDPA